MLLHNLAMCASREHVESNITPKFLGGSSPGGIEWSPTLIDISDILLSSSRLLMSRISFLSSFNFRKLSFMHIRMSATQASFRDIASHGLNAIESGVSSAYRWYVNPLEVNSFAHRRCVNNSENLISEHMLRTEFMWLLRKILCECYKIPLKLDTVQVRAWYRSTISHYLLQC